jgi:L-ribulose-5-phosphate 3-epimerase
MKKAFSLVLDRKNYSEMLGFIKEAGFEGVEPTFHPQGIPSPDSFEEDAEKLAAEADKLGLEIPSMRGGPLFWPLFGSGIKEEREQAAGLAQKAFSALKLMRGDTLLIVPGEWSEGESYLELYENCLDTARRVSALAEKMDMTAGFENVENKFLLSPLEWIKFIDDIGSSRGKMYFDVGNPLYVGNGWPDSWIKDLGKRICRVHFKDYSEKEKKLVPLLAGDVNWKAAAGALKELGYDGWISAELLLPESGVKEFLTSTCSAMKTIWEKY